MTMGALDITTKVEALAGAVCTGAGQLGLGAHGFTQPCRDCRRLIFGWFAPEPSSLAASVDEVRQRERVLLAIYDHTTEDEWNALDGDTRAFIDHRVRLRDTNNLNQLIKEMPDAPAE